MTNLVRNTLDRLFLKYHGVFGSKNASGSLVRIGIGGSSSSDGEKNCGRICLFYV